MPFYTFKCPKCKDKKDVIQSIIDEDVPICKKCSSVLPRKHVKMERVFGNTGKPQFKGKGFYETDYKKKS